MFRCVFLGGLSLIVSLSFLAAAPSPTPAAPEAPAASAPSPSATPELYSAQTLADLQKIQEAALTNDYAYRQVAHLSNNIGPRLSGSLQAQKAVEYVAEELKKLGLEVQLEKVMVPHWVRGSETAELVQWPGGAEKTTQKIVLTALGGSVATPTRGLTAEVVTVHDFDELNSLGRDKVRGKIVLFDHPFDKEMAATGHGGEAYGQAVGYRGAGASAAARLGAVAALVRSVGGAAYRLPHTGVMHYAPDAPKIPTAAVTEEDSSLIATLTNEGSVRMRLVLTPQTLPDVPSYNVIGDLKGTEFPEQVVIVSGHLDSWDLGTGAIDDGAGVAVAMQTANLVRQLNLHPRRTIRVIAWMNEENGTRGGKGYAKDHAAEINDQFAAIETDLGADHPIGINVVGQPELRAFLQPIAKVLAKSGAGVLTMRSGAGEDVSELTKQGVPSFSPIQDSRFYFNYHHTAADTLDKVDPRHLAETAAINAVLAYGLANVEQPLPHGVSGKNE
jgi:carboxypeptidase Q